MIKAFIIDDEPASLETLRLKLQKVSTPVEILQCFLSPVEAIQAFEQQNPDVIFLDIDMPDMDGFSFLEQLPVAPEIIFTTAHAEYAIKAIRHSAIDFLLKPIDIQDLKDAVYRLRQKLEEKQKVTTIRARLNAQFDKIPIPSMRGTKFLAVRDIVALIADSNYTTIHLVDKSKIVSTKTLGYYEPILEPMGFLRIHHSSIINLSHMQEYLRGGDGGSVIMIDGTELDIARRRRKEFMDATGSY